MRPLHHVPPARAAHLAAACLGLLLLAGGCGYSTSRPFREDLQTIHVEMFQSKEFRRDLEFQLTESLIKRIQMDTPYRIAPLDTADALFSGEILNVDTRAIGSDFDFDLPREIGVSIVIRYRLKDLRSGEILVDRPRYVYQATSYIPPVGETFSTGMVRAMDEVAEQIVETMENDW